MTSLRDRGFINFYGKPSPPFPNDIDEIPTGMQRFGTSSVPTHVTGLHILRSNWSEAIASILSLREGEHPDCLRARLHWLEDEDLEKSLEVMPRRSVAERSVWEFWKRIGSTSDKLGALGSVSRKRVLGDKLMMRQIPRNLRTMYVHAYQSYLWNLVVSERIKLSATQPLAGDLVFEGSPDELEAGRPPHFSSRRRAELSQYRSKLIQVAAVGKTARRYGRPPLLRRSSSSLRTTLRTIRSSTSSCHFRVSTWTILVDE